MVVQDNIFSVYADAGLCCIPIKTDGSKGPWVPWLEYQTRKPTAEEILRWGRLKLGVAIVGGLISGGLEVIDLDTNADEYFWAWRSDKRIEAILCKCCIIETPKGGYHIYYRCSEVSGNHKIAQSADRKETYFESRGQGGYVLAPGCPASCHPTGNLYVQVMGPVLPEIPTISTEERLALWNGARKFDKRPLHQELIERRAKELKRATQPPMVCDSNAPWEAMKQWDWADVLEPHGWRTADGKHWIRSGKQQGHSAVVEPCSDGNLVLVVFSANAGPLSPSTGNHKTWDQFSAYAALNYDGDRKAAAKAARRLQHA